MKLQSIMKKSFIVNFFLIIVKILFGIIFGSIALIADGVHSVSDLLSDIFVILGINHSLKPADEDHPFGHGKFEYVLSFILGLSIILIASNESSRTGRAHNSHLPDGRTWRAFSLTDITVSYKHRSHQIIKRSKAA